MQEKTTGGWVVQPYGTYNAWRYSYTGSKSFLSSAESYDSVDLKVTRGHPTPGFHKRKRAGELLPFTSFEQYELKGSVLASIYDVATSNYPTSGSKDVWEAQRYSEQGNLDITEQYMRDIVSAYESAGQTSLQAAAANLYQEGRWDALTFLTELPAVIDMFQSLGRKLLALIRKKPPGMPWNLWLEGRYGWRTLLFDFKSFSEMIQDIDGDRARRRVRSGMQFSTTESTDTAFSNVAFNCVHRDTRSIYVSVRGTIVSDISLPDLQLNPLITAWEVVRFSFVIDWFLGVGRSLAAISFLMASQRYAAGIGFYVLVHKDYQRFADATAKSGYKIQSLSLATTSTASWTYRTPGTVPIQPFIGLKLDASKILDLLALLTQALFRR